MIINFKNNQEIVTRVTRSEKHQLDMWKDNNEKPHSCWTALEFVQESYFSPETATQVRLQHLLTFSPAVIYTCEPSSGYRATFVSKNIKDQMGYEPDEFVGDPQFWVNHVHPEDAQRIFDDLGHLIEKGHYTTEYRFQHKDGTYRWVRDELRMVRDSEGNPLEIVGCWIDITERKKMEEEKDEGLPRQYVPTLKSSVAFV